MAQNVYSRPALRDRLKRQVLRSSKGGRAGQWSARKAQLLAAAYKRAGGGYRQARTATQRSLAKWSAEKWRTSSDNKGQSAKAIRGAKTTRYLPDAAWRRLTAAQRAATNRKKLAGKGQFVKNTKAAERAGRKARGRR